MTSTAGNIAVKGFAALLAAVFYINAAFAQTASYEEQVGFGTVERPLDKTGDVDVAIKRFGMADRGLAALLERASDMARFESIFDGSTLEGWKGDARLWTVMDGAIRGHSDGDLAQNTFLIYSEELENFALKLEYKMSPPLVNNSGVQYRSVELPGGHFALTGMQADIDFTVNPKYALNFAGMLYDERGSRNIIATKGQRVWVSPEGARVKVSQLAHPSQLMSVLRPNGWNRMRVIACGRRLVHEVNGQVFVDVIDDHRDARIRGVLGLQIHKDRPYNVFFRSVRLDRTIDHDDFCAPYR